MRTAEFIAKEEGLRLEPYRDQAGYPTIGVGHLLSRDPGADLSRWKPITREEALRLLDEDLERFVAAVRKAVPGFQEGGHRETACVSLAFNIGPAGFAGSRLARLLNNYDASTDKVAGVILEWLSWNKITVDGKKRVSEGLLNRRRREVALFFGVAD